MIQYLCCPSTRGDIDINELDYEKGFEEYYRKWIDGARARTREKDRKEEKIDNDKYTE